MTKTSEAQKRATQGYRARNRQKSTIQSARSAAKTYIKKYVTNETELNDLQALIDQKRKELETKR
ncbi:hypothetical protein [Secundilactobacillus folii]|uniref:Uncharacterized protein n=1 Tax=Secundilactobacillus folii TaxID=2678357 RepID=A0A7X2XWB6_9LACO|nr:hypothetical protein [Secundilactobacillus folii]MTV82811.1 hypothetical protein [Secundilactobacillus folii]